MSNDHFKSQTSTVHCFRLTKIVSTLIFSFHSWRQVQIKISKMIWLCQAARATKPVFCLLTKKAMFAPITHCFRFIIVQLKWTFSVQWIRKLLISETVRICCSAKEWQTLNIGKCICPPLHNIYSEIGHIYWGLFLISKANSHPIGQHGAYTDQISDLYTIIIRSDISIGAYSNLYSK